LKKAYFMVCTAAIFSLIAIPATSFNANAWQNVSFSGRSIGVNVIDGQSNPTFADTGELPPQGGELSASADSVTQDSIQTDRVDSVTTGFDEQSESRASAENVIILSSTNNQITADFVTSSSVVTCDSVTGSSQINNLVVEGQSIQVTGEANQQVTLSDGSTLIINEQTSTSNSIKVNALHLITTTGQEVIVASVKSDINCGVIQPTTEQCTKVTGGGFIMGTESSGNGKANFGFNARPDLNGHLNYLDHTTKLHVKSVGDLTDFQCVPACPGSGNDLASEGARDFSGNAELNDGSDVAFHVCVEDNGEPGRGDWFHIDLSNGYSNEGFLEGGNIQVHKN
jgi:hypothetical protein